MILGVDVSYWQGAIDWTKPKAAGAEFAFIRAGQGNWRDTRFVENWTGARGRILRSAYQFFDYRISAVEQAQSLMDWLGSDRGEMAPTLDWESNPYWTETMPTGAAALKIIKAWVNEIKRLDGRWPIFYTNPSHIVGLGAIPDWLKALPLFVANYGVSKPSFTGWNNWTFWQYALGKGRGPEFGTTGKDIDLDYFNGTLEELRTFAGVSVQPPAPEPETPKEETVSMYSGKARGIWLLDGNAVTDAEALRGKVDFIIGYAGIGDVPQLKFGEWEALARKLNVPFLGMVGTDAEKCVNWGANPSVWPSPETDPVAQMCYRQSKNPNGTMRTVHGWIIDGSKYTQAGGQFSTDWWVANIWMHVRDRIWKRLRKPIYPMMKKETLVHMQKLGGNQLQTKLENTSSVTTYEAAKHMITVDGWKYPGDEDAIQQPYSPAWDFWWYGAAAVPGISGAVPLFISHFDKASLYAELGFTAAPVEPDPEDPKPGKDPKDPPTNQSQLDRIEAKVDIVLKYIQDMRAL